MRNEIRKKERNRSIRSHRWSSLAYTAHSVTRTVHTHTTSECRAHARTHTSPPAVYARDTPIRVRRLGAREGEEVGRLGCICGLKMIRWLRWRHAKLAPSADDCTGLQFRSCYAVATMWLGRCMAGWLAGWLASKSPRVLSSFSRFFMRAARHRIRFFGYAPGDRSPSVRERERGRERDGFRERHVRWNRSGYIGSPVMRIRLDVSSKVEFFSVDLWAAFFFFLFCTCARWLPVSRKIASVFFEVVSLFRIVIFFFFLRSKACMYLEVRLNYKIRKKEKEENSSSNETCFVNDETYRFVLLLS